MWKYDIKQDGDQTSFHGDMLITEDLVLIGTDGRMGHVYAFDKKTGSVRWKYRVQSSGAPTDILRHSSKIYTVTFDDELLCLDLESGELLWNFKAADPLDDSIWPQSAAFNNGIVFFGSKDGNIQALSADDGKMIWSKNIGARITTWVVAHNKSVFFGAANKAFYRLSQGSGEVLAKFQTEASPVGQPTIHGNAIYFFLNSRGDHGRGETLVALELNLKNKLWQQQPNFYWTISKSAIWDNMLLTGKEGELIGFGLIDGRKHWSLDLKGKIRSLSEEDGMLYIGTIEGIIYTISTSNWRNTN